MSISQNDHIGWKPSGGDRSTMDLLWGCLATILAATWTVLHLNIPAPHETWWKLFARKLKWMIITIVAPECLSLIAWNEFLKARNSVKEVAADSGPGSDVEWTMSHAFFADMGGFVVASSDRGSFPVASSGLHLLQRHKIIGLPRMSRQEIMDRSKADGLSKAVACVQVSWLVIQCIARAIEHLPVTELELATCAFVSCMLFTYASWWHKPMDVAVTVLVPCLSPIPDHIFYELKAFSKNWDTDVKKQRIGNFGDGYDDPLDGFSFFAWLAFAVIFNLIHCAAWYFDFPTTVERRIWRVCSVITTVSPVAMLLSMVVSAVICHTGGDNAKAVTGGLLVMPIFVAYPICRMIHIVQLFLCLRSVPVGVYQEVSWLGYIPHI